jgi:hypothetical protein
MQANMLKQNAVNTRCIQDLFLWISQGLHRWFAHTAVFISTKLWSGGDGGFRCADPLQEFKMVFGGY